MAFLDKLRRWLPFSLRKEEAVISLTKEEANFARFALLLTGKCSSAVRVCFDGHFPPSNLSADLLAKKTNLEKLKKSRIVNGSQWKLLFPSTGSADSKTFDVTLMICLIRNLTTIAHPVNGFDSLPPSTETIPAADFARIKYYRNYLAHLPKSEIGDVFFNTAWSEIANAVGRLGGNALLQEVNELKIKILDRSNHGIVTEITNAVRELKQAHIDSERRPVQRLIDSTEEMMAFKLKEIHVQQPRAENRAYELLREHKVVVLAGMEGSGKTTMAYHLMKRVAEGYTNEDRYLTYIELKKTTDLKTVLDNETEYDNFVLFIDDPFGKSNTNKSWLDKWEKHFKDLHVKLQKRLMFVIFAIRESILSECQYELSKVDLFRSHGIVNLSSEEFVLTKREKIGMFQEYCNEKKIDVTYDKDKLKVKSTDNGDVPISISCNMIGEICSTDPVIGFPQSCHLFFSNPNIFKTGVAFFKKAREGLKESIALLYSGTEYEKKVLAVLVFMLLHGGKIDIDKWSYDTEANQQVCNRLGIKVNYRDLKNVLHNEKNYFMLKNSTGKSYHFKHETILESTLMVFGEDKDDQIILLKYAADKIVNEFLRSSGYKPKPSEICLVLHMDLCEQLLDRLLQIYPANYGNFHGYDEIPSESLVIQHATFQDKAMGVLLLELILKQNIINSQEKFKHVFGMIVINGHDEFLDLFLIPYHANYADNIKNLLSDQFIRSTLAVMFNFGDHVSVLKKLLNFDPTLLNVSQEVNERGNSDYIANNEENQSSPLILSALCSSYNCYNCVKFLLEQPVDLTVRDLQGNNVLHLSVKHTWTDVTEEIIRRQPQLVHELDDDGRTPFMTAAWYSNVPNADILLNHSNDLLIQDKDGQTVLHLIVGSFSYEFQLLYADKRSKDNASSLITQLVNIEPVLLNLKNKKGETPIFVAIKGGDQSNVQTLLDLKPDLTVLDNDGNGLLHICARCNMIDPAKFILGKHMEFLNQQNLKGRTPLMEAMCEGKEEFVKFLFDYNPDLKTIDCDGNNILHFCNDQIVSLCEKIIHREKDIVYMKNHQLRTPIEQAVVNSGALTAAFIYRSYVEVVKCLLRFDSGLIFIDKDKGHTMLHLAAEYCNGINELKICKMLLQYEPDLLFMKSEQYNNMTPLLVAADKMNPDALSYLLTQCKDIDCTDNDGNTVLHYCMRNVLALDASIIWLNICKNILQKKLDLLYVKNKNGAMPLLFVLESSLSFDRFDFWHVSFLMKLVVNNKANLEQKTKDGENLLHLVARNCITSYWQCPTDSVMGSIVINAFFEAMKIFANPHFDLFLEVNSAGHTPIMVAALTKNYKIFRIFLQIYLFVKGNDRTVLPVYFCSFWNEEFRKMVKGNRVSLFLLVADMFKSLYRGLSAVDTLSDDRNDIYLGDINDIYLGDINDLSSDENIDI